jgi:hypothetical protein
METEQMMAHMLAEIRTNKLDIQHSRTDGHNLKRNNSQDERPPGKDGSQSWREEMKVCLEKLDAFPEETDVAVKQQMIPKEEVAVETIGAPMDWRLAVRRHGLPKKRTQNDGGSRKKLAATRRRMIRRVVPARRQGRTHKRPTVEKRRLKKLKCNNGIRK